MFRRGRIAERYGALIDICVLLCTLRTRPTTAGCAVVPDVHIWPGLIVTGLSVYRQISIAYLVRTGCDSPTTVWQSQHILLTFSLSWMRTLSVSKCLTQLLPYSSSSIDQTLKGIINQDIQSWISSAECKSCKLGDSSMNVSINKKRKFFKQPWCIEECNNTFYAAATSSPLVVLV